MFETNTQDQSGNRWKIVIAVGLAVTFIVGVLILVDEPKPRQRDKLTGVLHDGDPDYGWYRKHVILAKPRLQMAKNLAGNKMAIFSATIENQGEKSLDVVELKMTFFNYETTVWETTRNPIRPGGYTSPLQPLKRRSFTLYIQDLPNGWLASHAEMDINGFRFTSHR